MTNSYELSQATDQAAQQREWARLCVQARDLYPDVIHALRRECPGEAIADLGCGPGACLPLLHASGFHWVLGIDHNERALRFAREQARERHFGFETIACNVQEDISPLPMGILQAVIATNVVIHAGFDAVMAGASRMLNADDWLAIADRDYAQMQVLNSSTLHDVKSMVQSLVLDSSKDYDRADTFAAAHGFRRTAHAVHHRELSGPRALEVFNFVEPMPASATADRLNQAYAAAAASSDLSTATVRVVDKWILFRRVDNPCATHSNGGHHG